MSGPRVRLYPPHLDSPLTKRKANELASDPNTVAKHPFYPFLRRDQHWTKFVKKGAKRTKEQEKTRPILYAARRDSYIFGYYRTLLNGPYEQELELRGLKESVLAYRRITTQKGRGGKCNIHFAKEAFDQIRKLGSCYAFALDIEHFFENLDHEHIKKSWSSLLKKPIGTSRTQILPEDHYKVFKAVTAYSCIEVNKAYKQLGLIGDKVIATGKRRIGYVIGRKDFPKQICTPKDFREKLTPLIERHTDPFGIPQGSPMSDILANLYMIEFDEHMTLT